MRENFGLGEGESIFWEWEIWSSGRWLGLGYGGSSGNQVMGSEDRNPISEVGGGKQGVVMEGKDGIVR